MAFTENSDPIEDLQIGTLEASLDKKNLKKLSIEHLNKLYDRVHNKREANVTVDDRPYNELSYTEQLVFNNMIVDTINYKHNIERRDNARDLNLKVGDVIKVTIRGRIYRGCPQFSKRGILKTDSRGRIIFITERGGTVKSASQNISIVRGKEKTEFLEKYKEHIEKRKNSINKRLEYAKQFYNEYALYFIKEEYEELKRNSPFKI